MSNNCSTRHDRSQGPNTAVNHLATLRNDRSERRRVKRVNRTLTSTSSDCFYAAAPLGFGWSESSAVVVMHAALSRTSPLPTELPRSNDRRVMPVALVRAGVVSMMATPVGGVRGWDVGRVGAMGGCRIHMFTFPSFPGMVRATGRETWVRICDSTRCVPESGRRTRMFPSRLGPERGFFSHHAMVKATGREVWMKNVRRIIRRVARREYFPVDSKGMVGEGEGALDKSDIGCSNGPMLRIPLPLPPPTIESRTAISGMIPAATTLRKTNARSDGVTRIIAIRSRARSREKGVS